MTNKLEITRDLAERILSYGWLLRGVKNDFRSEDRKELRALLAAPVVEGQKIRPVAYKFTRPGHIVILKEYNSPECYFRDPENWLCEPLYAEQPAPVAVVLPDRFEEGQHFIDRHYRVGWNACLDKVKELNQ